MKKLNFNLRKSSLIFGLLLLASIFLNSCGSTKVAAPEPAAPAEPELPVKEEPPVPEAPVAEVPAAQEPEVQVVSDTDDEYSRSVGNVSVSRDVFAEDKERVLKIISELSIVMKDMDYKSWLNYVDKESINYWSMPANLKKAQGRLPVKGLRLLTLQDYFKYVFVPARKGKEVTEIRYISDKYIKAIQVLESEDIVYYYFNKIDGYWMVNIPKIED